MTLAQPDQRWKVFRALAGLIIVFLVVGRALHMNFRASVGLVLVVLVAASSLWTTWKTRHFLRKAMGRKLRNDEETSIKTWMTISDSGLDTITRELQRNPFESVLNEVGRVLTDEGLPDHNILKDLDDTPSPDVTTGSPTKT
jgi:hypothetical protein